MTAEMTPLDRDSIIQALQAALQPLDSVLAFWEGGSIAFGRGDQWSDIDLQVLVEDETVGQAFAAIEQTLEALSPIDLRWLVPTPTWHGHAQRFYKLQRAGRFLLVDLSVLQKSHPERFLEPEQHGQPRILFDKQGLLAPPPFRPEAWRARMLNDLENLKSLVPMFEDFVEKELARDRLVDAINFYLGQTLRPLVTLLGMRYRPLRYHFGLRYLKLDFPPEVYREIEDLLLIRDAQDLEVKQRRAQAIFRDFLQELDLDALPLDSLSAQARAPHSPPA